VVSLRRIRLRFRPASLPPSHLVNLLLCHPISQRHYRRRGHRKDQRRSPVAGHRHNRAEHPQAHLLLNLRVILQSNRLANPLPIHPVSQVVCPARNRQYGRLPCLLLSLLLNQRANLAFDPLRGRQINRLPNRRISLPPNQPASLVLSPLCNLRVSHHVNQLLSLPASRRPNQLAYPRGSLLHTRQANPQVSPHFIRRRNLLGIRLRNHLRSL
jgi:hypothetical protein